MAISQINTNSIATGAVSAADLADGSVTAAKLAAGVGGKVLQVVTNSITSAGSLSGGSWQTVVSATITPSSSSNRILVLGTGVFSWVNTGGGGNEFGARLYNGTAPVIQGDSNGSATRTFVQKKLYYGEEYDCFSPSMIASEIAGTTSPKTYSIQGYGSENQAFYYNRTSTVGTGDYTFTGATVITLMEISA